MTGTSPGYPLRPRGALNNDHGATHVLHFGHYCGAPLLDRLRGRGLWVLITAADYSNGAAWSEGEGWTMESPKNTSVCTLTAWVSALAGYPVTLTRDDDLIDPGWQSLIAYRASRSGLTVTADGQERSSS